MKTELDQRPTRHGKIARLPHKLREELNQRLRDGQGGKPLLRWLNDQDEVYPSINAQNLTEWRQGGYLEWLARQEQCEMVWRFAEEAQSLEAASQGVRISQCLSIQAAVQLILVFKTLLAQPAEPRQHFEDLQRLIRSLALLRREDTKAQHVQFEADKFRWQEVQKDHDEYKGAARFQEILHGIAAKNAAADAEIKAMEEEAAGEDNPDEFLPEKPQQPKKAGERRQPQAWSTGRWCGWAGRRLAAAPAWVSDPQRHPAGEGCIRKCRRRHTLRGWAKIKLNQSKSGFSTHQRAA